MNNCHIIMPVKDAFQSARQSIEAIVNSGFTLTVYNDFSTLENTHLLKQLSQELHFTLINLSELTTHPSPNYLFVLQHAQSTALKDNTHLIIIESDVIVRNDTIRALINAAENGSDLGMVAAITNDDDGQVNFPYLYARKWKKEPTITRKRLSFCCTLITYRLLQAYSFQNLDPDRQWHDVYISHKSLKLGFKNLLLCDSPAVHRPHQSRPWKLLKYTNPLKYYWLKICGVWNDKC